MYAGDKTIGRKGHTLILCKSEIGNTPLREIAFLSIHSTLHLLGYDHERSSEDDARQCERQNVIINTLKFK